jgi:addiction module HigA family antidote
MIRSLRSKEAIVASKKLKPVHPGEILLHKFLEPMGLSQNKLARDLGVPPRRINEIVLQKRRITADTALRLARYFKMSPEFWLGLQMDHDLEVERDLLGDRLVREVGVWQR